MGTGQLAYYLNVETKKNPYNCAAFNQHSSVEYSSIVWSYLSDFLFLQLPKWILMLSVNCCRTQWSRVLRPELSSPAQTLGLWVLDPLATLMSLCVCSACRQRYWDGLIPRLRILPTVYTIKKLKMRPRSYKRAVELLIVIKLRGLSPWETIPTERRLSAKLVPTFCW
jgi:hypothetical protein